MIHDGALLPSGMKIPDRNSSGRIVMFTIAAAASELGIAAVTARPSAQNAAAPTISTTSSRSSDIPDGMAAP